MAFDRTGGSRRRSSSPTLSLRHQAISASHSSRAGSANCRARARLSCQPIHSVPLGGVPSAPGHQADPVVQLRLRRRSRPSCAGLAGVPSQTRPGWPHRSRLPQSRRTGRSGLHPRAWRLATGRSVYNAGHASPRHLRILLGLVACWSRVGRELRPDSSLLSRLQASRRNASGVRSRRWVAPPSARSRAPCAGRSRPAGSRATRS